MPLSPSGKSLNLKTRLSAVALIALLLGLVPSGFLLQRFIEARSVVAMEARALPVNAAWRQLLAGLQQHRVLAAEAMSTRADARPQALAAQQSVGKSLQSLQTLLQDDFAPRHGERLATLGQHFELLAADFQAGKLNVSQLLVRQQQLASEAFDAITDFNGDAGLLLDPEAGSYYAIIAGLQAAPRVEDALSELGTIAHAAAIDDIGSVSAALTRYREHAGQMLQHMQAARREGGALADQFAPLIEQARQQRQLVEESTAAAARDVNYPLEQLAASFATAAKLQGEISSQALHSLESALTERNAAATTKRNLLLVLLPSLLGVLVLMLLGAMRRVLGPVQQMVEVTERIAAGDLSQAVPAGGRDELGQVLQGMAVMQQRLRELVEQIQQGAGGVRLSAQEIAAGNQDLSTRSEAAAAALQRTSANITELDEAVARNSQAAGQASELARQASELAGSGGAVVARVVSTMSDIDASSARIADIIGVIDGIAFQTNILALNAAVEAARAGEQGRGFAVVASEVRALAGRSAEAAKEIKSLIQQSVERVGDGSALAAQAGDSMEQIVGQVNAVSRMITDMAGQARAQAEQTRSLGQAVRQVDAMTQSNAALVEQSAASATSLQGRANEMEATARAFRL